MEQLTTTTPLRAKVKKSADNGKPLTQTITVNYVNRPSILEMVTPELKVLPMVKITPELAEELLALNDANRPFVKNTVNRYADMMRAGMWIYCGNTICISRDMLLQDGQHTLMAVRESGVSITANIQTGLEPIAFTVMDSGRTRSAGDMLAIMGFKNYNVLAAAIKPVIHWEKTHTFSSNLRYERVNNKQVEEFISNEKNKKLILGCLDYVIELKRQEKGRFLASSTMAAVYFVLSKVNRNAATDFINMLSWGENISMENHAPIYLVREKLINFTEQHAKFVSYGGGVITNLKAKYIFRAWNAWRTGEKITKLQIDTKDAKIEKPV